ncbi:MAG: ABC transporter permease [candidate division FCPU426 bacterium]
MKHLLKFCSDTYYVYWREIKHFWQQKTRVFMSVFQPLVWFVLMGSTMNNLTTGLANASGTDHAQLAQQFLDGAPNYLTYVVGGIVAMTTLFGGIYGGTSVVWDRRLGFLQKMLAAPISRASIPLGKMLAVAFQALLQVAMILLLARLFGVHFRTGLPGLAVVMLLASLFALGMSGLSLALGARIKSMETLFAVMNVLTMPLIFSSPAMFPARAMPSWLLAIAAWNPVTYVLIPMRALIYKGWLWPELLRGGGLILAFATAAGLLAVWQFRSSHA